MTTTPDATAPTHANADSSATEVGAEREAAASIRQFKTSEVVDLLDLSRRQLQYWAKTRLVEPSARTPGGHHRYDFNDLVALKATRRLIDAGVSVQKIRKSVGALRELLPQVGRPLSELVLVATGDVVLVFHDETVFEAITGQEWVFPVAAFEREVADFRSRQAAAARRRQARSSRSKRAGSGRAERGTEVAAEAGAASGNESRSEVPANMPGGMPSRPGVRSAQSSRKRLRRTG